MLIEGFQLWVYRGHSYGENTYALIPTDLVFEHGRTYALQGPSGCGKTTMIRKGQLDCPSGQTMSAADQFYTLAI